MHRPGKICKLYVETIISSMCSHCWTNISFRHLHAYTNELHCGMLQCHATGAAGQQTHRLLLLYYSCYHCVGLQLCTVRIIWQQLLHNICTTFNRSMHTLLVRCSNDTFVMFEGQKTSSVQTHFNVIALLSYNSVNICFCSRVLFLPQRKIAARWHPALNSARLAPGSLSTANKCCLAKKPSQITSHSSYVDISFMQQMAVGDNLIELCMWHIQISAVLLAYCLRCYFL